MNHLILTVLLSFAGAVRLAEASVCNPNPCKNGGTCQQASTTYDMGSICKCQPGYKGYQCQWDYNGCGNNSGTPCQNGGRCVKSGNGGSLCLCPGDTDKTATHIRFGGHYCEIVNPCASCPINTVYCYKASQLPSGRVCLNAKKMLIA